MTLAKAIEILTESLDQYTHILHPDFKSATKLGIEALKLINDCQKHNCTLSNLTMPGEPK